MNLHTFVERFREDLVYKAPEEWSGRLTWFFDELKARYPDVAETDEEEAS